jgi:hypothetical protein
MKLHVHRHDFDRNGFLTGIEPVLRSHKSMRRSLAVLSLAVPLAGAACSTSPVVRIAEPVGPAPSSPSFLDEGRLVVHTPMSRDPGDLYTEEYPGTSPALRSPYTVYDAEGHTIQTVTNYMTGTAPEVVSLPQGEYLVRAKGPSNQLVDVTVRIDHGKTTEVFLDGSHPPNDMAPGQIVRGPDGKVVGWRATAIGGGPPEK